MASPKTNMPFLLSFQIKNVIPDCSHLCALYQRCYGIVAEKKRRLGWIKRKKGRAGSFPDKKGRSGELRSCNSRPEDSLWIEMVYHRCKRHLRKHIRGNKHHVVRAKHHRAPEFDHGMNGRIPCR